MTRWTRLTEREWVEVFRLRCKSKSGGELTKVERALTEAAYRENEKRYARMEIDVFNATVPFGSSVRITPRGTRARGVRSSRHPGTKRHHAPAGETHPAGVEARGTRRPARVRASDVDNLFGERCYSIDDTAKMLGVRPHNVELAVRRRLNQLRRIRKR